MCASFILLILASIFDPSTSANEKAAKSDIQSVVKAEEAEGATEAEKEATWVKEVKAEKAALLKEKEGKAEEARLAEEKAGSRKSGAGSRS